MSLSVRPQRRSLVVRINRSQSFAGVNSPQDKSHRTCLAFRTPTVSRKSGSRVSRMFSMSHKSPPPKVPQPERLDEVHEALKKGLTAYLEVHQLELEKLSTQIRESKRNSRLGFLYDLDKQVKSTERFLRRLEFHASKIDELYESYCIQRRLRDGAHNMVKAYTAGSPGSKEARESLAEAGKGYKEYTENMCLLESELESQLGEFHIKMKGLAGFARLCAGDQYEIFMRYGRQRWKLRGRIEANGKQVWDSEEMIFLPLITEFLSIKVTELRSLASHVVVGNVSCETKDLFVALPQVVAVDINDLGTIKLSLEVSWNPFDKEDQPLSASTVSKTSTVSKRLSTYNQSPPDTPSMREQAFYSLPWEAAPKQRRALLDIFRETLLDRLPRSCSCSDVSSEQLGTRAPQGRNMLRQQEDLENGAAWSISSESSDDSSSPQLSGGTRHTLPSPLVHPAVQAAAPAIEIAFTRPEDREPPALREEAAVANGHVPYARTLSQISEASVDLPAAEDRDRDREAAVPRDSRARELPAPDTDSLPQSVDSALDAPISEAGAPEAELDGATPVAEGNGEDPTCQAPDVQGPASSLALPTPKELPPTDVSEAPRPKPADCGLEEALCVLASALGDYRGQFPELQTLEQELKHLKEILLYMASAGCQTLTLDQLPPGVSADTAPTHLEPGDKSRSGRFRMPCTPILHRSVGKRQRQGVCLSRASSMSLTVEHALESFSFLNASDTEESGDDDDGLANSEQPATFGRVPGAGEAVAKARPGRLSSGGSSEPMSTCNEFLDRALVLHLNHCNHLLLKLGNFGPLRCREMYALDRLAREAQVLEMVCRLLEEQAGTASSAGEESFLQTFTSRYAAQINERQQGLAHPVGVKLVEELLQHRLPRRRESCQSEQITLFQYWIHFEALPILTLDTYILELTEEVLLARNLNSDDQDVVLKALKRIPENRLGRDGLNTLSLLLIEGNSKVVGAVSTQLRNLSENPIFRERASIP
ncbi:Rho family-interacting cell polarization regulator 1 [Varanus komodoensis]|nr:Rho family-interacting cell polarization regulator 1 [Varanus komodoensis]